MTLFILGSRRRGRPTRLECRATERVVFMVTPTERAALQQVATDNGQPLATVIREAVNCYVGDYADGLPVKLTQ